MGTVFAVFMMVANSVAEVMFSLLFHVQAAPY